MKVETVQIKNFRSISFCEIECCGGFNVLIGKNNSGKSNVLSAINAFFSVVSVGDMVCLDPPVFRDFDFHNKDSSVPAEVILTFCIDGAERAELLDGIIQDSPQLATAVGNLDQSLRLKVHVSFTLSPDVYACVNRIVLAEPIVSEPQNKGVEHTIIDVDQDAASTLYRQSLDHRQDEARIETLEAFSVSMDESDWARARRDMSESEPTSRRTRYLMHRVSASADIQRLVENMLRESATYEGFQAALQTAIDEHKRRAVQSDRHQLAQGYVTTFSGNGSAIPAHVLALLAKLAAIQVLNVTDVRRSIGRDEAQRILDLKTRRGGQEPLQRIQDVVSDLLGVKIDAFSGEQSAPTGRPMAELDIDDFVVEVNGSGIKEALRLLLDIEFQQPDLLLVEEPEIHLHPALETAIMKHLKKVSLDRQMFITTHSTNLLDTPDMDNIYLVSKTSATSVEHLGRAEAEERIPEELGIRLSSLFIHDCLIFVESENDEKIIRTLASTLNVSLDHANVGFIKMGGARTLSVFASSATLSLLAKRQVKMIFVIDRDERDEGEVSDIQKRVAESGLGWVLSKREIENYLISPRALAEHIEVKMANNEDPDQSRPSSEQISVVLSEVADELKELTVFKRAAKNVLKPLYPERGRYSENLDGNTAAEKMLAQIVEWENKTQDRKNMIHSEAKKQAEELEIDWQDRKFEIVPGDLLIDKVYERYGVRFHKNKGDGVELAGLLRVDEIDAELKELITKIHA